MPDHSVSDSSDSSGLQAFLAGASVDPSVFGLRPDYRALLLAVDGITPGPSDESSERLLVAAESAARTATATTPVDQLSHIAAWREAYRAFGAKPQRTRNSVEALTRRAAGSGLPRVNRLTDLYNAISVLHQLPLGGEDLSRYQGPPRLLRATRREPFDTAAEGEPIIEHPVPGEVVWCDDAGVTCRRWNWRQCRRTGLTGTTRAAYFVLDALAPITDDALLAAADALREALAQLGGEPSVTTRMIRAS